MIEKRICAEEDIVTAYLDCGSSGIKTGTMVVFSGGWAVAGGPSGKAGKPGYAKAGDLKVITLTKATTSFVSGGGLVAPNYMTYAWRGFVDKLHYTMEDSDLTKDTLVSGQSVLVYLKGTFDTDQYNTAMFNAAVATGALLYVDDSGLLHTGNVNGSTYLTPVAMFWGFKGASTASPSTYDSNYTNTGYISVSLINRDV